MPDRRTNATIVTAMWPSSQVSAVQYVRRAPHGRGADDNLSDSFIAEHDRRERQQLERLLRADYERCHPDDSFDDLKRRARFSKEDKGLLRAWCAVAEHRNRMRSVWTMSIAAE